MAKRYRAMETGTPIGSDGAIQPQPQTFSPAYGGGSYDAGGPPQYSPALTTGDPYDMAQEDRKWAYDRGNRLDQDARDEQMRRYGLENYYGGLMNDSYAGLAAEPGYTDQEMGNIVREDELRRLGLTPEESRAIGLSDAERNSIAGNVNAQRGWYDPAKTDTISNETGNFQRNAYGYSDRLYNDSGDAIRGGYERAIDPAKLGLSEGYGSGQGATLNATEANVRKQGLGLSDEFNKNYQWTPEDQQSYATQSAKTVGDQTRARQDEVAAQAQAAGYNSPMALAAAYNRLQMTSDQNEQEAYNDAILKARQLGLDVAATKENMRLGAANTAAGYEMDLGGRRLTEGQQREAMRLGAAQDLSGRQMQAASDLGGFGAQRAQYTGTLQTGVEGDIGNRKLQNQYTQQQAGMQMEKGIDDTQAQRAQYLAENRQNAEGYRQNQRYGRGMDMNTQLSGRYGQVADARRGGQQEYRNWATGQTNTQAELGQNARQQRIANYGTQSGAVQGSTGQTMQYDLGRRGQSFGTNFKSGAGASLGKFVGTPSGWFGGGN